MTDMAPIPLETLLDDVTVTEHVSATAFRPSDQPLAHEFRRVRVQSSDKMMVAAAEGNPTPKQKLASHIMFVDVHNSINVDAYTIQVGDKVTWNNQDFTVIQVDALRALRPTPHHWEVWLQ
jgi:plastocyanin